MDKRSIAGFCRGVAGNRAARRALGVSALGIFFALLFFGSFNTALDATNTLEFCISCHEMRDNVYQEYKLTVHYANRTGVRAVCPDCHVPRDWLHKVLRKAYATRELWGTFTGSIDTREKFEARRIVLAVNEWSRMKESDSRECRNCHSFEAMNAGRQKPSAQRAHARAVQEKDTCIDCHKGIAHLLPKEFKEDDE